MVISGHDQISFEPLRVGAEVAMSPGGVKGDENQIRQNDRLRKSEHDGNEDKSAHQCVVYKIGARARDPIQCLRLMMNGMKTP